MTIHRINPGNRWSDITVFNGIAHFVEVADSDTSADMKGQVEQILSQAEGQLAKIGSDRSRVSFGDHLRDRFRPFRCIKPSVGQLVPARLRAEPCVC